MPSLKGLSDLLLKEEKLDLRVNPIWAFLFGYVNMNYKINKISELKKERKLSKDRFQFFFTDNTGHIK